MKPLELRSPPHLGQDRRDEDGAGRRPPGTLHGRRLRVRRAGKAATSRSFRGAPGSARKRGTQRSVVQWRSSIATADPTSTNRSGEAVESRPNTWEGARMPCSSTPWKTSIETRRKTGVIRNGASGSNLDDLERAIDEMAEQARDLAREALNAAGYHQHHRGEWRKRRGTRRQ